MEVDEVDFNAVKLRLENRESVFMIKGEREKVEIGEVDKEANAKGAERP